VVQSLEKAAVVFFISFLFIPFLLAATWECGLTNPAIAAVKLPKGPRAEPQPQNHFFVII